MPAKKKQSNAQKTLGKPRKTIKGSGAYKESDSKRYYRQYRKLKEEKDNQSIGSRIGSFLGHGAQQIVKALTGFGDYNVEANSIMEGGMSPPEIVNTVQKNGFIVRHREYIMDVLATQNFTNTTLDINPGLGGTFPYLTQIAKAFELYRMRGLVFEFKSMSSDAVLSSSASSSLGVVAMATQYNSLNPAFTTLIQMENHEFASASKPSCDFYHPVECKKSLIPNTELYVRTGDVDKGDIRLYDIGQFNIATSGMQNASGNSIIGQLWATYEVEFFQARYDVPTGILTDHIFNTSISGSTPLGSVHSFSAGNSIGLGIDTTSITFPQNIRDGHYLILMRYVTVGSAAAFVAPLITAPAAGTFQILQMWGNGTGPDLATNGNSADVTSTTFHLAYIINILSPSVKVSWGTAGTIPSSNMDLFVTQMDADIVT